MAKPTPIRPCTQCQSVGRWQHKLCPACQAPKEAERAAYKRERYDAAYRATRAMWAKVLQTHAVSCARCHTPIGIGGKFHLDHLPSGQLLPSHPYCNQKAVFTDVKEF